MLNLTATERMWLETATERPVVTRLEISSRATGTLLYVIDSRDGYSTGQAQLLPGGSVRVDTAAECLRTASIAIADPGHELSVGLGALIGPDKRFTLYKGYDFTGAGDYHLWPLGVYELSGKPALTPQGGARVIQVQLADKSSNANGRPRGGLLRAVTASQGLTKLQALQAIAAVDTWGETNLAFWQGSTAVLTYDLPWDDNRTPWEAAQAVNEIPEPDGTITRLYYDPLGRLTLAPDPGPNIDNLPAVWSAAVTPDGLSQLVSASKELDLFKLTNAVQVKWGSQLVTPGVYWSIDSDANSETSVDKIGYIIWRWKNGQQDELIRNLTEATYRGDFERRRRRAYEESVPFSIVENPALEPWDSVYIGEPLADIAGNYQLLSYTISLDEKLEMPCQGWKVRKIV